MGVRGSVFGFDCDPAGHPGDPNLPPEESVQCRYALTFGK
jgi:hypothetical protein